MSRRLSSQLRKLDEMFQANVTYYHQLVEYILAGEQGCRELAEYIAQRRSDVETSGDNSIQFELQSLEQAQMMLGTKGTGFDGQRRVSRCSPFP